MSSKKAGQYRPTFLDIEEVSTPFHNFEVYWVNCRTIDRTLVCLSEQFPCGIYEIVEASASIVCGDSELFRQV